MAQINKPNEYFNTVTWTGNGSKITTGLRPDLIWYKARDVSSYAGVVNAIRGDDYFLQTFSTDAETYSSGLLVSDSTGFTPGSVFTTNSYVAWNWLANGSGVSNTDGSITSTVSANTTSGFSIVTYTGTGANATVGHGLGVTPAMMIVKRTELSGGSWRVYHKSLSATSYLLLEARDASASQANLWNNTEPTSSVFTIGTAGDVNLSSYKHIAYVFAEKKGFSKFGSYVSNANVDGTFVYTGFKPAFIIVKNTSAIGNWFMLDNKRNTYNPVNTRLTAEGTYADDTGSSYDIDFVSNGFKLRTNSNPNDGSGNTYIYMAFAENPLVGTNGIPATAR